MRSGGENRLQQQGLDSQKHYSRLSTRRHYRTFVDIHLRQPGFNWRLSWNERRIRTVKSVNLCYLSTLVVSSEKGDFIWVSGRNERQTKRKVDPIPCFEG